MDIDAALAAVAAIAASASSHMQAIMDTYLASWDLVIEALSIYLSI